MSRKTELVAKDVALTVTFAALYAVFGLIKLSPIVGLPGQAITAAAIIAPIIGILAGPYIGALSTLLGGTIGLFFGAIPQPSFVSGLIAATCSGLISRQKRLFAIPIYAILLSGYAFYPVVGPVWLFPTVIWFQLVGLIILVSPLQAVASKNLNSNNYSWLLCSFFITSLTSTLTGQIAGNLTLEIILTQDTNYFTGTWIATTLIYPIERIIIALAAALTGTALFKVLKSANLMPLLNHSNSQKSP
jgi:hypothetical protein